jgi:hypothetical protein
LITELDIETQSKVFSEAYCDMSPECGNSGVRVDVHC